MTAKFTRIVTDKGVPMVVRYVPHGERYGREGCLKHVYSKLGPMVEFYDERYKHEDWMGFSGQFISRYYVNTLRERNSGQGLCLNGGVPIWDVDAKSMGYVLGWLEWVEEVQS